MCRWLDVYVYANLRKNIESNLPRQLETFKYLRQYTNHLEIFTRRWKLNPVETPYIPQLIIEPVSTHKLKP